MKRPLLWSLMALCLGILMTFFQCEGPVYCLLPLLLVPTPLVFKRMRAADVILVICIYSAGVFNGLQVFVVSDHLEAVFSEVKEISGVIETIPVVEGNQTQLDIQVEEPLALKGLTIRVKSYEANKALKPGDQVNCRGELTLPQRARNPGGFDEWLYLKAEGVEGIMKCRDPGSVMKTGSLNRLKDVPGRYHQRLCRQCDQIFNQGQSELIKGVVLGEKTISESVEAAFRKAGVSHVLSVSGLHVTGLYGALLIFMRKTRIKQAYRLWLAVPFLIFYVFLTGAKPSVIRATIMLTVMILGEGIQENTDSLSALCLAAIVILIHSPAQLFSAGFQLSFSSVLGILFFNRPLCYRFEVLFKRPPGYIVSSLILTLSATVGTLPSMLVHFRTVSLIGILANLAVVPLTGLLMGFSVMALLILGCFPTLTVLAMPAAFSADLMTRLAFFFARLDLLVVHRGGLNGLEAILVFGPLLIITGYVNLKQKKIRKRAVPILSGILVLLVIGSRIPQPMRVTFLDVGQGDSALVETPSGQTYLIDGGGDQKSFGQASDQQGVKTRKPISERVLLPALYAKGIQSLDGVFISHHHADHCQGIEELLKAFPIKAIYITSQYGDLTELMEKEIPIRRLGKGDCFQSGDGMSMEILWPEKRAVAVPEAHQNDASLVMRLSFGACDFLFTGDIEAQTESVLIDQISETEFLKVGHHGSKTSSTAEFLEKLNPSVAVISVGRYNTFGHPAEETLQKFQKTGTKYFRTDEKGAVEVVTDGREWVLKTRLGQRGAGMRGQVHEISGIDQSSQK